MFLNHLFRSDGAVARFFFFFLRFILIIILLIAAGIPVQLNEICTIAQRVRKLPVFFIKYALIMKYHRRGSFGILIVSVALALIFCIISLPRLYQDSNELVSEINDEDLQLLRNIVSHTHN